jgi:hypothetical protein
MVSSTNLVNSRARASVAIRVVNVGQNHQTYSAAGSAVIPWRRIDVAHEDGRAA